jgi:glutamyl-tRNA reductase
MTGDQREYVVVGVSHHTAPVAVREQFAVAADRLPAVLEAARARPGIEEAVLLSTCNRVEWYLAAGDPEAAAGSAAAFFAARRDDGAAAGLEALRVRRGVEAVRHAFRVTSGLDSMMVGETEILGQVRAAFAAAQGAGTAGPFLDALLRAALAAGRRVRQESGIGREADTVPAAAAAHARRLLGALEDRRVLVIGAGRMAEATVRALVRAGVSRITVANRSPGPARRLAAAVGGEVARFDRLDDEVRRADIVLAGTASPHLVLDAAQVAAARGGRSAPLVIIDIAVPRNVDPRSRGLAGVHLYDIDDLRGAGPAPGRGPEPARRAERLVEAEVAAFLRARAARGAAPAIAAACAQADAIVEREWARARPRLATLSEAEEQAVRSLVRRVTRKILHGPIAMLAETAGSPERPGAPEVGDRAAGPAPGPAGGEA